VTDLPEVRIRLLGGEIRRGSMGERGPDRTVDPAPRVLELPPSRGGRWRTAARRRSCEGQRPLPGGPRDSGVYFAFADDEGYSAAG
jgi:hypothetical protein